MYLNAVAVPAHQGRFLDVDVDPDVHVFVGVLRRADAAFPAADMMLVGIVGERGLTSQDRERDVTLENVKVPRDDARLLWHLNEYLQSQGRTV